MTPEHGGLRAMRISSDDIPKSLGRSALAQIRDEKVRESQAASQTPGGRRSTVGCASARLHVVGLEK